MVNMRKFVLSHKLFWGFSRMIDLDEVEEIDEIIKQIHQALIAYLEKEELEVLVEKADINKLHIHDETFGTILLSQEDKVFYICDHV